MVEAGLICGAIEATTPMCYGQIVNESPAVPIIAVVDDDESVRESVAALVESVGYQVVSFGSAEDFLGSLDNLEGLNCMILDVRLPGISGVELHSRIGKSRSIPAIFITAHPDPVLATKPGIVAVLYKPFEPEVLLKAARSAIGQSSS
jgi:FixJ family two-component response regulator